jgi:UDP:flavonoid glycosyltransferase YjiC (YdhE family)
VNARRLKQLGAARTLSRGDLNPQRLRALAEAAMTDAGGKRALRELSESLRLGGGAKRAADIVLAYREAHQVSG